MKIDMLGVFVDRMDIREVRERFSEWLVGRYEGLLHQVVTVNPEFVMEAKKNREFRNVLNNSSLALTDGVGLVFASVFLYGWNNRLLRITGVDCLVILARLCARTGNRIYLLGAGVGVARLLAVALQRRYPHLIIAGAEEGISKEDHNAKGEDRDEEICKRIIDSRTDVLLVALGAPKQDFWIARNAARLDGVRIAVGVGGAFDYVAGVVPYAPQWIRRVGLEWMYRLMIQPERLRRIGTAVVLFPLAVLRSKFFDKKSV